MKWNLRFPYCLAFLVLCSSSSYSQWIGVHSGFTSIYPIFPLAGGTDFLLGTTDKGIYRSSDSGSTWSQSNSGLTNLFVGSLAYDGPSLFAGTHKGIFVSTNDGTSWTAASSGLTNQTINCLTSDGTNIFAGTQGGVFVSSNNGMNWNQINSGLTNGVVNALLVNDGDIFAGTGGGGVFVSTDQGTSWSPIDSGLTNFSVNALLATGGNLFAGTNGGAFLSTNNGMIWAPIDSNLTNNILFPFVLAFAASGTNLFVGTYGGVFLSTNNGTSWAEVGFNGVYIYCLVVVDSDLFAGTNGSGLWKRPLSEMITLVGDPINSRPSQFELGQNYPNPFNPKTTIHFELPKESHVHLELFNVLAQSVLEILDEKRPAGAYDVKVNAGSLSSGIYFYRLTAGNFVQTKKMVLMK